MIIKPATAWALHDFRGEIKGYTVHRTRTGAIKCLTGAYVTTSKLTQWRYWRRNGWCVIRVNIEAVRP